MLLTGSHVHRIILSDIHFLRSRFKGTASTASNSARRSIYLLKARPQLLLPPACTSSNRAWAFFTSMWSSP